jgi:hypothetical protein
LADNDLLDLLLRRKEPQTLTHPMDVSEVLGMLRGGPVPRPWSNPPLEMIIGKQSRKVPNETF